MTDDETRPYMTRLVNPGANTKKTVWLEARSRWEANRWADKKYQRFLVECVVNRTPPDDADVIDATKDDVLRGRTES